MKKLLIILMVGSLFISCSDEDDITGICTTLTGSIVGEKVLYVYSCYDIYTKKECLDRDDNSARYYEDQDCIEFCEEHNVGEIDNFSSEICIIK